jgi:hypothetical protein
LEFLGAVAADYGWPAGRGGGPESEASIVDDENFGDRVIELGCGCAGKRVFFGLRFLRFPVAQETFERPMAAILRFVGVGDGTPDGAGLELARPGTEPVRCFLDEAEVNATRFESIDKTVRQERAARDWFVV